MPKPEVDEPMRERVERLVSEETRIQQQPALTDADYRRLRAIHAELDEYWELLRLRRSVRESQRNPNSARFELPSHRRTERSPDSEKG